MKNSIAPTFSKHKVVQYIQNHYSHVQNAANNIKYCPVSLELNELEAVSHGRAALSAHRQQV